MERLVLFYVAILLYWLLVAGCGRFRMQGIYAFRVPEQSQNADAKRMPLLTTLPMMPPMIPPTRSAANTAITDKAPLSVNISGKAQCLREGAIGRLIDRFLYHRLVCSQNVLTHDATTAVRPLGEAFWEGLVNLLEAELQKIIPKEKGTPVLASGGSCRCGRHNFLNSIIVDVRPRPPSTRSYLFDHLP
ncbi:uncharacterized protein LOC129593786 [Paramacrobiotus metropolitanus]|uniref:uncharacterized protein LOC129593786 n=1 Tax=Paramacrobiotus metropolitanus TaxID=2943436 RepID=UPI0024457537|nr:uncharacterized protein LOC129593786 [Paramacrobiotus metropolitanus]